MLMRFVGFRGNLLIINKQLDILFMLRIKMNKNTIISYLKKNKKDFLIEFGINKIGLFGSYARGEETKDSDIDILIELEKNTIDIHEKKLLLKEKIEQHFHKDVDIAREKYLRPIVKEEILKEATFA